jgi:3-hydroxybutyrate dehydrogenase/3-oxoacyl-[acyl-carrier protein] reductase
MGQLDGKVAVITAGSTGIGFGIAKAFVDEGATVVLGNRSEEKGAHALARLNAGDRAVFKATDALVCEQVEALIDFAAEKYGSVDILVNCAGGSDGWAMIDSLSNEAWQKAFDWNCSSAFWATRRALKYMLPKQYGRIINISSIEGKLASKMAVSHYIMGKHAMNGLTKATAAEYATQGIRCNAICPGTVDSPSLQERLRATGDYEAARKAFIARQPIGRIGQPEEVADLALYLAGATYTTGQIHVIDGGWTG